MRNFDKMATDELYALWECYLRTDFGHDPIRLGPMVQKVAIRLTPNEIVRLTNELFDRLLEKEGYEPRKD